jgi:hypothetical protein
MKGITSDNSLVIKPSLLSSYMHLYVTSSYSTIRVFFHYCDVADVAIIYKMI